MPGVGLISPPPHHDIYSIEDLAQLIHDLKNANPQASVSVKLVSEVGVGTVAAGVAKAKADHVVIAGHDGGTGASPWSSIKHAGTPWELGLAETQQTLVLNRLRGRIRVQADGQMKTGRDVVIGALLGADEFGFATAPLVVEGCIMMRKCHLNTCPVGRGHAGPGAAREVRRPARARRQLLLLRRRGSARRSWPQLGIRKFDELIGRVDLLDTRKGIAHWKARGLDFSRLLQRSRPRPPRSPRCHVEAQDHGLAQGARRPADREVPRRRSSAARRCRFIEHVRNVNRTVGAMLSGELIQAPSAGPARSDDPHPDGRHGRAELRRVPRAGDHALPDRRRQRLHRQGPVGRAVVVRPSIDFRGDATQNIIVGNTVLYGATSGEAFFRGVAGERFAVRLSGATAVVEGTGDHGCEYMTGGTVVVLGKTGRNFAAGMSGGIAYVYDEDGQFASRCNTSMVSLGRVAAGRRAGEVARARDLAPRTGRRGAAQVADQRSPPVDRQPARARDPRPLGRGAAEVRQGVPERVQARARRDQPEGDDALGEIRASSAAEDAIAKARTAGKAVKPVAPK